ncbi:MAG: Tetratricopeptide 4, partial [Labilithrix sp.]|nr:Tetratricopeptide 4 [Labilithrix sp.]
MRRATATSRTVSVARIARAALVALVALAAACSAGSKDTAGRTGPSAAPAAPLPDATLPVAGKGPLAPSLVHLTAPGVPHGAGASLADVEDCATCHADVAGQWRKSAHAFASFNNPVYRVVVDRLRKDRGDRTSQFCGGCHDVSLLVDDAMASAIDPEDLRAHGGIGCKTCHSIAEARPDGNGSYDLDLSPIPVPRDGDDESILRHRARVGRATLRTGALCASCHKSFLDESTGNAHHLIGQDDATPWARSAYAGSEAARIDEDVPQKDCRACHMPRVAATSGELGAKQGTIASHGFLGGHTWLAAMQNDPALGEQARRFIEGTVSIDVGGLRHEAGLRELVVGGRGEVQPGEEAVLDVVLRNLDVGHRFPGGVMDADGTWVEVTVDDARGRRVAEAGTTHEATGADPTAHVLASYMARKDGTRLDVRETHEFQAGVYNNTLPPRDATVIGYGFVTPDDEASYPLQVTARLRHRTRNLELQRAACADSRSERGRSFGRVGLAKVARALDACRTQPVTDVSRAVATLARAGAAEEPIAEPQALAFRRRFAYGLGLSHALQERLDDARLPLGAALALAGTPRERAMALGAMAAVASRQGRVDETFTLAAQASAAAAEAGMDPPIAMQRVRAEALASTWRLAEAAPLFV